MRFLKKIKMVITSTQFNAFTLAEVLITLAIIGVVAALTIPALSNKIQDIVLRTQWKKAYSTLESIISYSKTQNGGDLIGTETYYDNVPNYFADNLKYITRCSAPSTGVCWHDASVNTGLGYSGSITSGFVLPSGAYLIFWNFSSADCTGFPNGNSCYTVIIDANGTKGPNQKGQDIFMFPIRKDSIDNQSNLNGVNFAQTYLLN